MKDIQQLVNDFCDGKLNIVDMQDNEVKELAEGLSRMYAARVFNCVDGTGKSDTEWGMLSTLFHRLSK